MNRPAVSAILLALAVAALPPLALPAQEHSRMAPLAQYLMDPRAEIALAQTAAPQSISKEATVLVLSAHGYVVGKKGASRFTCIVERGWMPPFDQKDFWSTTLRAPICYNAPASRTVLQYTLRRTTLALAGLSRAQIYEQIKAMSLPTPAPGSMSYMLSKKQNLGDVGSWMPHIMFHVPKPYAAGDGAIWGADLPGSPILFDNAHHLTPEPQTIFMVPVSKWSDGSPAPSM